MVESTSPGNSGLLVSRMAETSAIARQAAIHMARLQNRIFERYQTALDKAELALEQQKKFIACSNQVNNENEALTRTTLKGLRTQFYILAQIDAQAYADDLMRIANLPINQVLQAEEAYWTQTSSQLSQELLGLEEGISLEEASQAGPGPQDAITTPLAMAWPDILKVPIGGIDENTDQFQFAWPQKGDVDPSIFAQGVRVVQIKFLANYDMRGIQLKLSNGLISPIFQQGWPNKDDHHDGNRTNRVIHCNVADGEITKANVRAYRHEHPFMKKLLLTGDEGKVIADVESRDDYGASWDVDVPRGYTFVGMYGRFGYAGGYTGIHGMGLLMHKK